MSIKASIIELLSSGYIYIRSLNTSLYSNFDIGSILTLFGKKVFRQAIRITAGRYDFDNLWRQWIELSHKIDHSVFARRFTPRIATLTSTRRPVVAVVVTRGRLHGLAASSGYSRLPVERFFLRRTVYHDESFVPVFGRWFCVLLLFEEVHRHRHRSVSVPFESRYTAFGWRIGVPARIGRHHFAIFRPLSVVRSEVVPNVVVVFVVCMIARRRGLDHVVELVGWREQVETRGVRYAIVAVPITWSLQGRVRAIRVIAARIQTDIQKQTDKQTVDIISLW